MGDEETKTDHPDESDEEDKDDAPGESDKEDKAEHPDESGKRGKADGPGESAEDGRKSRSIWSTILTSLLSSAVIGAVISGIFGYQNQSLKSDLELRLTTLKSDLERQRANEVESRRFSYEVLKGILGLGEIRDQTSRSLAFWTALDMQEVLGDDAFKSLQRIQNDRNLPQFSIRASSTASASPALPGYTSPAPTLTPTASPTPTGTPGPPLSTAASKKASKKKSKKASSSPTPEPSFSPSPIPAPASTPYLPPLLVLSCRASAARSICASVWPHQRRNG